MLGFERVGIEYLGSPQRVTLRGGDAGEIGRFCPVRPDDVDLPLDDITSLVACQLLGRRSRNGTVQAAEPVSVGADGHGLHRLAAQPWLRAEVVGRREGERVLFNERRIVA